MIMHIKGIDAAAGTAQVEQRVL